MHRGAAALYAAAAVAVGALPATTAAFSGSSGTSASAAAATLGAPTGLSAAQSCGTPTSGVISQRGTATVHMDANAVSLRVPVPAARQAGDLLVAHVAWRVTARTISAPDGWTAVRQDEVAGGLGMSAVFIKRATEAEPTQHHFQVSGNGDRAAGAMTAWTGVDATTPVATHAGVTATPVTSIAAPSVAATRAGSLLMVLATQRYEDTINPPTGMTERYDHTTTGGGSADRDMNIEGSSVLVDAGGTGARTATPATSGRPTDWIGQTVVLNPVQTPAAPDAALAWTATADAQATGYELRRYASGTLQNTRALSPRTLASATEGPLQVGTAYTWELRAVRGSWRSATVTAGFTPSTC